MKIRSNFGGHGHLIDKLRCICDLVVINTSGEKYPFEKSGPSRVEFKV